MPNAKGVVKLSPRSAVKELRGSTQSKSTRERLRASHPKRIVRVPEEGERRRENMAHRSPARARDLRRQRKGVAVIGEAACKTYSPVAGIVQ
jgi:hypothetical protein